MKVQQNFRSWRIACTMLGLVVLYCGAVSAVRAQVSWTWTNSTGSTLFWTNTADVWRSSVADGVYPGVNASAPVDNVYLTNALSSYAVILDTTLADSIGTLAISNTLGNTATLIVTNGAVTPTILTNTTVSLNNGGRLQIDNGGVVTGITSVTWLGTTGVVTLNTGGQLFSSGLITIGSGRSNINAAVNSLSTPGQGGVWNLNTGGLTIGNNAATGNVLTVTAATLTNVGTVIIGNSTASLGNSLILSNGARFFSGNVTVGNPTSGGSNNAYNVGGLGEVSIVSNGTITVGNSGSHFNTMTITNANLWSGGAVNIGLESGGTRASNTTVRVLSNAVWNVLGQALTIGNGSAFGGSLIVDSGVVTNIQNVLVGGNGATSNSLTITNGGKMFNGTTLFAIGNRGSTNNSVTVTGAGSALYVNANLLLGPNIGVAGSISNRLSILDGGVVTNAGGIVGGNGGTTPNLYNSVLVSGGGSVWSNTTVEIGKVANSSLNSVTVSNTATLFASGAFTVGTGASANSNSLTVINRGEVRLASTLTVGAANSTGNVVRVFDGGILQGNSLITANAGAGNVITNSGGVYQFTSTTITVTPNGGAGSIAIDGGTIAYRLASGVVNLTNNWGGSQLANLAWSGNNTLRLLSSTATNTLAGGYIFDTGLGATNYSRLELISGTTGVAGNGITVGGNGSLLISNTTATVAGALTNYGAATVANSIANFSGGIFNTNSLTLNTATLNGAITNTAGGTLRGNGFITGNLINDATISPGFSVGSLSITGNVSLGASSLVLLELAGVGSNDMLFVSGDLAFGGTLTVTNLTGFTFAAGQAFQLFQFDSLVDGSAFSATNLPDVTALNLPWNTQALGTTGTLSLEVIPEPGAVVLVLLGLGILWRLKLRPLKRAR
ncbi:MAG: hypothetical protein PCFJNLEI_00552 [Verrucomicrobiae bacterium]|nr:hypothetical protein [Verrucomicrobiae bacterium]